MIAVPPTILDDFSIPHLHPLCWAPVVADAAVVVACPAVVAAAVDPEVLQIWKKWKVNITRLDFKNVQVLAETQWFFFKISNKILRTVMCKFAWLFAATDWESSHLSRQEQGTGGIYKWNDAVKFIVFTLNFLCFSGQKVLLKWFNKIRL